MKRRYASLATLLLATIVLAAALARTAAQAPPVAKAGDLVVHEWGTFLAMSGSDGIALDGMYHEEHALPSFVHARSTDQLRLRAASLKGETPVIYFYTNRAQKVRVRVGFPQGVWTQWYPQASAASPSLLAPAAVSAVSPPALRDGQICWNVELTPPARSEGHPAVPTTAPGDLWNHARRVEDAAFVRPTDTLMHRLSRSERNEAERFIFYRGLGRARLPLTLTAANNGTLAFSGSAVADPVRHLFVLRVGNGRGVYRYLPALAPGQSIGDVLPSLDSADALPLAAFSRKLGDDLAARLVEAGLYPQEARAMVNTWRQSYFHTGGVRVLFVLPQTWTDRFIPISVRPAPRSLVRVMVGRLEMLTPERERRAEEAVRALAASDPKARALAFAFLQAQGRYAEPVLRRVLQSTKDAQTRALVRRLLLTPFVTELRTAAEARVGVPEQTADGDADPIHVRARLATLLRDSGLANEAKTEARAVLAALAARTPPPMNRSEARHHLRSDARALEASGDDRRAANAYARFVRFASQVKTADAGACTGCHVMQSDGGPRDMRFFRDWWAGHRFARTAARSGQRRALVAAAEAALKANPKDAAAQLQLAYLYENDPAKKARVAGLWARLETTAKKNRPAAVVSRRR